MAFSDTLIRKLKWLEVPHHGRHTLSVLKNPDLEPMPKERRLYGFWAFFGYWSVPNVCVGTFAVGSAMLALGLNIPSTMGTITIGNILIVFYTCLMSRQGVKYKIGYTVSQRTVFGIYGSSLGILIRILTSIVSFASMTWVGGLAVVMMLSSWSESFLNMHDSFPSGLAMTTRDFIGFLLFYLIECCFFLIKPEKMGPLLNGAALLTGISFFGIFGHELHECYKLTGGPGSMWHEGVTGSSSEIGWTWLQAVTVFYGGVSASCTNMSDYSRFGNSNTGMMLGISLSTFLTGTVIPLIGMATAAATQELYGEVLWMPTDVCFRWLADNYTPGTRAAVFFCGLAFASSQLATGVLQCGYAGGMDLSAVCPRYINMFRGAMITGLISWVCQPWNFYNTASTFNNTMGAFGVVMTPIMGVMTCDFVLIRKQKVRVSQLFTLDKDGDFYFTKGVNWRAMFCFFAAVAPGLPGLAAIVNPNIHIPVGLIHYYENSTVFSFFCPAIVYYLVCLVFPLKNAGTQDEEDYFDVFEDKDLQRMGMRPCSEAPSESDVDETEEIHVVEKKASDV